MKNRRLLDLVRVIPLTVLLAVIMCTGVAHADMGVPSGPFVVRYLAIVFLPIFLAIIFTFLLIVSWCAQFARSYDLDFDNDLVNNEGVSNREIAKQKGKRFRAVVGTLDLVSLSSTAWYLHLEDGRILIAVIIFLAGLAFTSYSNKLYRQGKYEESKKFLVMVCVASVVLGLVGYFMPGAYGL